MKKTTIINAYDKTKTRDNAIPRVNMKEHIFSSQSQPEFYLYLTLYRFHTFLKDVIFILGQVFFFN